VLPKLIERFNLICIGVPAGLFVEIDKLIFNWYGNAMGSEMLKLSWKRTKLGGWGHDQSDRAPA
jgi:hypothetical protein